jgi:hypothetical protein
VKLGNSLEELKLKMPLTVLLLFISTLLASCGTTKGILDGTGEILEGIAEDVRTVGGWLE